MELLSILLTQVTKDKNISIVSNNVSTIGKTLFVYIPLTKLRMIPIQ